MNRLLHWLTSWASMPWPELSEDDMPGSPECYHTPIASPRVCVGRIGHIDMGECPSCVGSGLYGKRLCPSCHGSGRYVPHGPDCNTDGGRWTSWRAWTFRFGTHPCTLPSGCDTHADQDEWWQSCHYDQGMRPGFNRCDAGG